jgi:triacylglycerol lipase
MGSDMSFKPVSGFYTQHPMLCRTALVATVAVMVIATSKKTAHFAVGFFSDLLLLLPASGITAYAACIKSNFDPKNPSTHKTPILMIPGNGFNEMQWLYGRIVLQNKNCGPVFTLNLDGLLTNKAENGIQQYADIVQTKMKEIRESTGNKKIVLIGHSMGGLVAGECERREKDNVEKVITISTPWNGTPPLLKFMTCILPSLFKKNQRYRDMRDENNYITNLKKDITTSKFRTIYSTADEMVPDQTGSLGLDPKFTCEYNWLGHYSPMIVPSVWNKVLEWVQEQS